MGYFLDLNPRPKVRMTQRTKWSKRAQECLEYQAHIAWLCTKAKVPSFNKNLVEIDVLFFRQGVKCDIDNLIKAFLDGLQYGKIIKNDKQVQKITSEVQYVPKGETPGIYFSIKNATVTDPIPRMKIIKTQSQLSSFL